MHLSIAHPDPAIDETRPILVLHGFASSPHVMRPFAERLQRVTARRVVLVRTGALLDDLRTCARQAQRVLDLLIDTPDFEFADVVGHSMGGLIATYLLKRIDRGRHIRKVITLGSPHRGARLAAAAAAVWPAVRSALGQMAPGSAFLADLRWAPVPVDCEVVSISSRSDYIVPEGSTQLSELPGHRSVSVEGGGHLRLVFSESLLQRVARELEKCFGAAGASSDPLDSEHPADLAA